MTTRTRRTSLSTGFDPSSSPRLAAVQAAPRADSAALAPARLDALEVPAANTWSSDWSSASSTGFGHSTRSAHHLAAAAPGLTAAPLVAPALLAAAERAHVLAPESRARTLGTVAAWRRADGLHEASVAVPSWAMAPLPTDWSAAHADAWRARETAEADEAEERGLALAMAGLAAGGVIALAVGAPATLGAVVGLVAGAAVGWRPPLPRTAETVLRTALRSLSQRRF